MKILDQIIAQAWESESGGNTTYSQVKLTEVQNAELLKNFVSKSLIMEASRNITLNKQDMTSVWFSDLLGGTKRKKTKLGTGEFDKFSISKPIKIDWEEPFCYAEGLPAYAKDNFPATVSQKLEAFLEQDSKDFERDGFKKLEAVAKANTTFQPIYVDFNKTNGEELFSKIVTACDAITQLVDKKHGIDFVEPEKIIIFAKPSVLNKISGYAMKGDHTTASLKLGSYDIGSLGGYRTLACPYLKDTNVVITTTNSMANARKIIAASAGKIDNLSADLGAYLETTSLSEVVKKMIPTALIHRDSTQEKDA
ncbi:hypothetical protein [Mycoplasmopsis lipofaciens]|uniref:hypothetical protein n=1 Tax=Mycoplasmopsis lipofaciens TaxID=114884 RepID=UPI000569093C|nr:hypothetical protein [Mycoplasmopsis lipofaciens]